MRTAPQKTASKPLAFLSDVHGNIDALNAVLSELSRRAVTDIFVAGDLVHGGAAPMEVWRRLQEIGARCTRGASDIALATISPARLKPTDPAQQARAELFARTRRDLGDLVAAQLGRLPLQLRIPIMDGSEILMVHGSPRDALEGIGHELDDDEVSALLNDDPADVIVVGATHVPFRRAIGNVHVINVGSVGEAPEGRCAHFTIVSPKYGGALIEQDWVEY
jgi:predicted phosphodiesterase